MIQETTVKMHLSPGKEEHLTTCEADSGRWLSLTIYHRYIAIKLQALSYTQYYRISHMKEGMYSFTPQIVHECLLDARHHTTVNKTPSRQVHFLVEV